MIDLRASNELCRLLGDSSRVRLLNLLAHEELSVAELTRLTGLAQSRVSTHLARLKEAGLVRLRKNGSAAYWASADEGPGSEPGRFWAGLRERLDDPLLAEDGERARDLVRTRAQASWADSVAGQMERHYSPGRTFESTARAMLAFTSLGKVVDVASGDGALAELIAGRAKSVTCVDISPKVVAAGQARLKHLKNVRFVAGDMHELPLPDRAFEHAFLMNALTYARDVDRVLSEAARVLEPGGRLAATTLESHAHPDAVGPYDHLQLGFTPRALKGRLEAAGFSVELCRSTHEEKRAPHFKVITVHAQKKRGRS